MLEVTDTLSDKCIIPYQCNDIKTINYIYETFITGLSKEECIRDTQQDTELEL